MFEKVLDWVVDADELQHVLRDELTRIAGVIEEETALPALMGQP